MGLNNVRAVVLAAGRSTRFKRKESKLASRICGLPMILFLLKELPASPSHMGINVQNIRRLYAVLVSKSCIGTRGIRRKNRCCTSGIMSFLSPW